MKAPYLGYMLVACGLMVSGIAIADVPTNPIGAVVVAPSTTADTDAFVSPIIVTTRVGICTTNESGPCGVMLRAEITKTSNAIRTMLMSANERTPFPLEESDRAAIISALVVHGDRIANVEKTITLTLQRQLSISATNDGVVLKVLGQSTDPTKRPESLVFDRDNAVLFVKLLDRAGRMSTWMTPKLAELQPATTRTQYANDSHQ